MEPEAWAAPLGQALWIHQLGAEELREGGEMNPLQLSAVMKLLSWKIVSGLRGLPFRYLVMLHRHFAMSLTYPSPSGSLRILSKLEKRFPRTEKSEAG